jgi:hypothetical protein
LTILVATSVRPWRPSLLRLLHRTTSGLARKIPLQRL